MPKLKTNKAARKRFAFTGSGRVKRKKAHLRHILTGKGKKRKRQLRHGTTVKRVDEAAIRQLLPYG